jgi:hypothetical protein
MTTFLSKYISFSESINMIASKTIQLCTLLNKVLTGFIVLIMLFLSLFAIIGMASHTQKLEADVGLRHKNISVLQVGLFNKIQNAILNPVKANAFSLNPLDGIGEIIGAAMKGVAEPIFNIVLGLIKNIVLPIFDAILKPILSVLNGILDTINGLLSVVDSLAANLSATRVGIGFRVFKDIQGSGQGSSNFESSGNFTKRMLGIISNDKKNVSVFNSNFPKKNEVANLLADTIAWTDFMGVQKALQSNLLGTGDITAAALKFTGILDFEAINRDITDIVIGKKCETSDAIFAQTPVFKSFGGVQNTCVAENRGTILQQINSRQQQVTENTLVKAKQYEVGLPADCKYGQYFEIPDGVELIYDETKPGNLASRIALFAGKISLKSISASECFALVTGKQNQTNSISQLLSPTNIVSSLISGSSITLILSNIFTKGSKELFSTISAKFNKTLTIIKSIANFSAVKSGIGLYGALSLVIGLREKINSRLDTLNQEYEQFRTGQTFTLDTNGINLLANDSSGNGDQSGSIDPCKNPANSLLPNGGGCGPGGFNTASNNQDDNNSNTGINSGDTSTNDIG